MLAEATFSSKARKTALSFCERMLNVASSKTRARLRAFSKSLRPVFVGMTSFARRSLTRVRRQIHPAFSMRRTKDATVLGSLTIQSLSSLWVSPGVPFSVNQRSVMYWSGVSPTSEIRPRKAAFNFNHAFRRSGGSLLLLGSSMAMFLCSDKLVPSIEKVDFLPISCLTK